MSLDKQVLRENGTLAQLMQVGGAKELQPFQIGIATDVAREIFRDATDFRFNLNTMDTTITGGVPFIDTDGFTVKFAPEFNWDDTNKFLGIGTTAPSALLTLGYTASGNNFRIEFDSGKFFTIETEYAGDSAVDFIIEDSPTSPIFRFRTDSGIQYTGFAIASGEIRIEEGSFLSFGETIYSPSGATMKSSIFHIDSAGLKVNPFTAGDSFGVTFGDGSDPTYPNSYDFNAARFELFGSISATSATMIRFNYDNGSTDDDVDLYVVNTSTFRIENKFGDGRIEFVVSTSSIAISVEAIGASGYPTLELLDDTRLQIGTDNDGYIYFDGTNHIAVLLLPEATTAPGGLASKGLWIDTDDDRTIKSKA